MSNLTDTLKEREAQVLATTNDDRDAMDESNPVIYAEGGPNRFALMSLFFTDTDGVRIEEDLDLNTVTVIYFTDTESVELTEGAVYDWAINYYRDNY